MGENLSGKFLGIFEEGIHEASPKVAGTTVNVDADWR
jgi:hypothetical protein